MDWWLLGMSCVTHCRPILSGSLHIIASHWDVESIFSIFPFLLEMQVCFNLPRRGAACHCIRAIMGQAAHQAWINRRHGDWKYPSCFCKVRVNPAKVRPPETNSDHLYAKQKCHRPEDVFLCWSINPSYHRSHFASTDSCSLRFLLPRWLLRSHFSFFSFTRLGATSVADSSD